MNNLEKHEVLEALHQIYRMLPIGEDEVYSLPEEEFLSIYQTILNHSIQDLRQSHRVARNAIENQWTGWFVNQIFSWAHHKLGVRKESLDSGSTFDNFYQEFLYKMLNSKVNCFEEAIFNTSLSEGQRLNLRTLLFFCPILFEGSNPEIIRKGFGPSKKLRIKKNSHFWDLWPEIMWPESYLKDYEKIIEESCSCDTLGEKEISAKIFRGTWPNYKIPIWHSVALKYLYHVPSYLSEKIDREEFASFLLKSTLPQLTTHLKLEKMIFPRQSLIGRFSEFMSESDVFEHGGLNFYMKSEVIPIITCAVRVIVEG